jgi:hypothetical protein
MRIVFGNFYYLGLIFLLAIAIAGCSRKSGADRHEVSGKITINGKPAPLAHIMFMPDSSQGVSGPGSAIRGVNGEYKSLAGKGVSQGAHIVNIIVYDGIPNISSKDGDALTKTPYSTTVTVPANDFVHDFDIPASKLVENKRNIGL